MTGSGSDAAMRNLALEQLEWHWGESPATGGGTSAASAAHERRAAFWIEQSVDPHRAFEGDGRVEPPPVAVAACAAGDDVVREVPPCAGHLHERLGRDGARRVDEHVDVLREHPLPVPRRPGDELHVRGRHVSRSQRLPDGVVRGGYDANNRVCPSEYGP